MLVGDVQIRKDANRFLLPRLLSIPCIICRKRLEDRSSRLTATMLLGFTPSPAKIKLNMTLNTLDKIDAELKELNRMERQMLEDYEIYRLLDVEAKHLTIEERSKLLVQLTQVLYLKSEYLILRSKIVKNN